MLKVYPLIFIQKGLWFAWFFCLASMPTGLIVLTGLAGPGYLPLTRIILTLLHLAVPEVAWTTTKSLLWKLTAHSSLWRSWRKCKSNPEATFRTCVSDSLRQTYRTFFDLAVRLAEISATIRLLKSKTVRLRAPRPSRSCTWRPIRWTPCAVACFGVWRGYGCCESWKFEEGEKSMSINYNPKSLYVYVENKEMVVPWISLGGLLASTCFLYIVWLLYSPFFFLECCATTVSAASITTASLACITFVYCPCTTTSWPPSHLELLTPFRPSQPCTSKPKLHFILHLNQKFGFLVLGLEKNRKPAECSFALIISLCIFGQFQQFRVSIAFLEQQLESSEAGFD